MDFSLFFSIFAVVMMTTVGGLLVWLHLRIGQLKDASSQLPMMEEKFTQSLMGARREMQELDKFAKEQLPGIDDKINAARKAIDEIDYMINRTEKAMDKAEVTLTQLKSATPDAGTVEVTTTVASAPALVATSVIEKPEAAAAQTPARPVSVQQQAYSASASLGSISAAKEEPEPFKSMRPRSAVKADGTPSYVTESISRSEMADRNKQSTAEKSLRESLAEILK